jgi:hypothetical protein
MDQEIFPLGWLRRPTPAGSSFDFAGSAIPSFFVPALCYGHHLNPVFPPA